MIQKRFAPDRSRELRDGEIVVDCAKAANALQVSSVASAEETVAERIGIARSALRRILGKDGNGIWAVITIQNAQAFASGCGASLYDLEFEGQLQPTSARALPKLESYIENWVALRTVDLGPYVPLTMHLDQKETDLQGIVETLRHKPVLHVLGSSGCGKTYLLGHLGVVLTQSSFCPIHLRAANFTGDADAWLERAVASCTAIEFVDLFSAARSIGITPIILVDALNETPPEYKSDLIAELQRMRLRHDVLIVTTGQAEVAMPSALNGSTISIAPPDETQKAKLIEAHLGRSLHGSDFALDVITSAHDAMIWASAFSGVKADHSRYALYAAFVRKKLGVGDDAMLAHRSLSALAAQLRHRYSFSALESSIVHTVERVSPPTANGGAILRHIYASGLVSVSDGLASFRHELFQHFFATEAILAECANTRELANRLRLPINEELIEFAVGALASSADVQEALAILQSITIVGACLQGRCGAEARATAKDLSLAAIERLEALMCTAKFDRGEFDIERGRYLQIACDTSACVLLQPHDRAILTAAAIFYEDDLLDRLLRMFSNIDAHIERERYRLLALYPDTRMAWRAHMFMAMYTHPVAIELWDLQQLLQGRKFGWLQQYGKKRYAQITERLADVNSLTNGQLYFLIEELHSPPSSEDAPPPFLYDIAERAWRTGIYHIRLAIAHTLVLHVRHVSEDECQRLTALAESWLSDDGILNSSVLDVLKALNALKDELAEEQAIKEFEEVLMAKPSQTTNERAFTLYGYMFDHPYDSVYCQAYYALSEEQRASFRSRAVETTATDSMIYSFLLTDVAEHPTSDMIPVLQRHSAAPNPNSMSVQESMSVFIDAISSLATLGAGLPQFGPTELGIVPWQHAAHILYSFLSPDKTQSEYTEETAIDWATIVAARAIDVPMRILKENWKHDSEFDLRFMEWSKEPVLILSRRILTGSQAAKSIFERYPAEKIDESFIAFAIEFIGRCGDKSDLNALTHLAENPVHGAKVIAAARDIERR